MCLAKCVMDTNKRKNANVRALALTLFALKRKKKERKKQKKKHTEIQTIKAQCALCSNDAKRKKVKFDIERNYMKVFECVYLCSMDFTVLLLHVTLTHSHTHTLSMR